MDRPARTTEKTNTRCLNANLNIVIATDAWRPQVNGVVRTYENVSQELADMGHQVRFISPQDFNTIPCPSYPSIRLALFPGRRVNRLLNRLRPDAIHVATEGPIGYAARRFCIKHNIPFTTSYHTQFPEYVRARAPIPLSWSYAYVRRFHDRAERTYVPTQTMKQRLEDHGFRNVVLWSRGVNAEIFKPGDKAFLDLPRPIFVHMGRIAVEKNIEAFLDLDLPGSKLLVGDGPDLDKLKQAYPDVHYTGYKFGEELAAYVAAADVFVFPSLTDTFGIVLLEAMSCGIPVAAYPVTGPIDVVKDGISGVLSDDLKAACLQALELNPEDCIDHASTYSWRNSAQTFVDNLAPIPAQAYPGPAPVKANHQQRVPQ